MREDKRQCPKCGSANVHRSRRRLFERMTGWLHRDQRMYRCHSCMYRFWDEKHVTPHLSLSRG